MQSGTRRPRTSNPGSSLPSSKPRARSSVARGVDAGAARRRRRGSHLRRGCLARDGAGFDELCKCSRVSYGVTFGVVVEVDEHVAAPIAPLSGVAGPALQRAAAVAGSVLAGVAVEADIDKVG